MGQQEQTSSSIKETHPAQKKTSRTAYQKARNRDGGRRGEKKKLLKQKVPDRKREHSSVLCYRKKAIARTKRAREKLRRDKKRAKQGYYNDCSKRGGGGSLTKKGGRGGGCRSSFLTESRRRANLDARLGERPSQRAREDYTGTEGASTQSVFASASLQNPNNKED